MTIINMNAKTIFHLNQLRCEVAKQAVLKDWQPITIEDKIKCPRCNSGNPYKNGHPYNKQRYLCRSCKFSFQEQPLVKCSCSTPGSHLDCQNCPRFKEFLQLVKKKVESLQELTIEELECLQSESNN